jgi:hypothetical protein
MHSICVRSFVRLWPELSPMGVDAVRDDGDDANGTGGYGGSLTTVHDWHNSKS